MEKMCLKYVIIVCLVVKPVFLLNQSVCLVKNFTTNANQTTKLFDGHNKTNAMSLFDKKSMEPTSFLYGILLISLEHSEKTLCASELKHLYDGILRKEIWALKAKDASAMPGSEFFLGKNFFLGSPKNCKAVQDPEIVTISKKFPRLMNSNLLTATPPFEFDYRVVYAEHRSPYQIQVEFTLTKLILHIGLCLPKSCSNEDIVNLTQRYFLSSQLEDQDVYEYNANVLSAKSFQSTMSLIDRFSFRLMCLWILFTLLLCLSAHKRHQANENESDYHSQQQQQQCFIDCFSIKDNFNKLFSVKRSREAVPAVDGIRSLGCLTVFAFHVCYFGFFATDNPVTMFSAGEQIFWQWVSTAPIYVDAFFTISGFLLAYNFLQNHKRVEEIRRNSFQQNLKVFGKQFLNRYVRLTPVYLFVLVMTEALTAYLVDKSVFWIDNRDDITCSKYWWRNLFYIQNFFDFKDLCLLWSWSLACEMQFFFLFLTLLFVYAKNADLAKKMFCGLFIISTLNFAILTRVHGVTPTYDVLHSLWNEFYMPSWMRITPYFVGVAAGYFNHKFNDKLRINRKNRLLLWLVAAIAIIASHWCTLFRTLSSTTSVFIITLIRIFYPASISWIIIASRWGYAGQLSTFLDSRLFVHLNKLSYSIYLLNPIVITLALGLRDNSIHFDVISWTILTTGIMVFVYYAAVIFTILFEMPYVNLAAQLFKSSTATKIPKSTQHEEIADKIKFM